jgi:hypothetical protein
MQPQTVKGGITMASYHERLKRAVLILDGQGSSRERLASAYRSEVQYIGAEGLNEEMIYALEAINDELTRVEAAGDKDMIDMTVDAMTDDEVSDLSAQIRNLYELACLFNGE